jgi:hypothetical protein
MLKMLKEAIKVQISFLPEVDYLGFQSYCFRLGKSLVGKAEYKIKKYVPN